MFEWSLPHRDQGPRRDEGAQLGCSHVRAIGYLGGVEVQEEMAAVAVQFGVLVVEHRVLDGQPVQSELLGHDAEIGLVRVVQVQPDHRVGAIVQVLADLFGGKAFRLDLAVVVHPRPGRALRRHRGGDRRGDGSRCTGISRAEHQCRGRAAAGGHCRLAGLCSGLLVCHRCYADLRALAAAPRSVRALLVTSEPSGCSR
jgi:hypothetical protein